ncbi:hypothetical protein DB41_DP00020 [Neochlamydia sp. TUME1]|nr:hypothetical protein DB41_DP00020 [Neochlamydia sp. TUME1]
MAAGPQKLNKKRVGAFCSMKLANNYLKAYLEARGPSINNT